MVLNSQLLKKTLYVGSKQKGSHTITVQYRLQLPYHVLGLEVIGHHYQSLLWQKRITGFSPLAKDNQRNSMNSIKMVHCPFLKLIPPSPYPKLYSM